MKKTYGEYSEFECDEIGIKFAEDEKFATAGAVGSIEETLDTKVVVKKYKGIEAKKRVKGTGTGTLKISLHMDYASYKKAYGMNVENLIKGVTAYGQSSTHPEFAITTRVLDEDDVAKLKAYPRCIITSGVSRKIENGGEEVAEIEIEVQLMPDEYGQGMYEALEEDLESEEVKTKWMTDFTPAMMQKATSEAVVNQSAAQSTKVTK